MSGPVPHPGRTGVWSAELRYGDRAEAAEAAAELEELGYTALWIPDVGGDVFGPVQNLLDATRTAVVATGILNLWMHAAADAARAFADIDAVHPGRFLVGIGVSHGPFIETVAPGRYRRPLEATERYLDEIDAADPTIPPPARVLAALGPRMLALARDRSAGAHPYLVTPEHTRRARDVLGAGPLLAPEQKVVLETDAGRAREIARGHLAVYLGLPNYLNNLRRLGFGEHDFAGGGSDRLIDAVFAWGDVDVARARVEEHRAAGADHVCVHAVTGEPGFPRRAWQELAPALTA